MDENLIFKAIEIAKNNKDSFNFSSLRKELHLCTRACNEVFIELESRGVISIIRQPEYNVKVLI